MIPGHREFSSGSGIVHRIPADRDAPPLFTVRSSVLVPTCACLSRHGSSALAESRYYVQAHRFARDVARLVGDIGGGWG